MGFRKSLLAVFVYLFLGIVGLGRCYAQGASLPSELPRGNTRADPELAPLAGNIDVAELYLASGSPEAKERALAMLEEAMGSPSRRQAAYASYRLANEHFKSSNFPRALEFLEPMIRTVDYNDPALGGCRVAAEWAAGVCLFKLGKPVEALVRFSRLLEDGPLEVPGFAVVRFSSQALRTFLGEQAGAEAFLQSAGRRASRLAKDEGGDQLLSEMIILAYQTNQEEMVKRFHDMLLKEYPRSNEIGRAYGHLAGFARKRGDKATDAEMTRRLIEWTWKGLGPDGWITDPDERLRTKAHIIWDWVRLGEIEKARALTEEIVTGASPELERSRDPDFRRCDAAYVFARGLENAGHDRNEVAHYFRIALSKWPEHDNPTEREHMEAFLAEVEGRSSKTE